jgi:hypothetical protein
MLTSTRILLLTLVPLIGASIGYSLVSLIENGYFVQWEPISGLPDKAITIAWLDDSGVWVETQSGTIYKYDYQNVLPCISTCWRVSSLPAQTQTIYFDVPYCGVLPERPSSVDSKTLCFNDGIGSKRIVYAVDKEGAVFSWELRQDDWVLNKIRDSVVGAVSGLFIALLIVLIRKTPVSNAVAVTS